MERIHTRKKRGRKPWIPDLTKVEVLASQGLTNEQIAACLGICEDTLYTKQRQLTEFSEAIKKGRASGIQQVSNVLFEAALAGNVTAMIFYLKVRAGWKEPIVTEQKHSREELIGMIEQEIETLAERRARHKVHSNMENYLSKDCSYELESYQ